MSTDERPNQPTPGSPAAERSPAVVYEIRVEGRLGHRWATWFDGMTLTDEGDGTSVLSGPVVDQAALHGQLQKLRDLGVTLLSLAQLVPSPVGSSERPDLPHDKSRCVQARHEHPGANQ